MWQEADQARSRVNGRLKLANSTLFHQQIDAEEVNLFLKNVCGWSCKGQLGFRPAGSCALWMRVDGFGFMLRSLNKADENILYDPHSASRPSLVSGHSAPVCWKVGIREQWVL